MSVFWRRGVALTCWSSTKKEMTADLNILFFLGQETEVVLFFLGQETEVVLFFLGQETEVVLITNCIACKYVENPY